MKPSGIVVAQSPVPRKLGFYERLDERRAAEKGRATQ
jgi:hypothetical protein